MEAKRVIAVSLAKLQGFRTQRGGMRLHRGLLVSYVLRNAKQAYLGEKYRQICQYQQQQQEQQEQEELLLRKKPPVEQAPTVVSSVTGAETVVPGTTTTTTTTTATATAAAAATSTTKAEELPGSPGRLGRKRPSEENCRHRDDNGGSPPKRPRIQQQHHQQQQQQQEQEQKPAVQGREVSTKAGDWKATHVVRYHPQQPLGPLSLNCMAVAAC